MRNFLFFTILTIVVFFQVSLVHQIEFFGITPNIPLVVLFLIVFFLDDYKKTMLSALFLGVLLDVFSGMAFGLSALTFLCTAFLADLVLRTLIHRENVLMLFAVVAGGTFVYVFLNVIFINIFGILGINDLRIILNLRFLNNIALEVVLNLLSVFILIPLRRILV